MLPRGVFVFTVTLLCVRASAQSIISTHSGIVHYFEGAVSIDGRALTPIKGRFLEVHEGSSIVTHEGRAEILLAPDAFLWLGRNSAIRMRRNSLADTRIEVLDGSATVQSTELSPDNRVKLTIKGFCIRLSANALFRIDALSAQLIVLKGDAAVTDGWMSSVVGESQSFALTSGMMPQADRESEGLDEWVLERRRIIAAANYARTAGAANPGKKRRQRHGSSAYPVAVVPFPRRTW